MASAVWRTGCRLSSMVVCHITMWGRECGFLRVERLPVVADFILIINLNYIMIAIDRHSVQVKRPVLTKKKVDLEQIGGTAFEKNEG